MDFKKLHFVIFGNFLDIFTISFVHPKIIFPLEFPRNTEQSNLLTLIVVSHEYTTSGTFA